MRAAGPAIARGAGQHKLRLGRPAALELAHVALAALAVLALVRPTAAQTLGFASSTYSVGEDSGIGQFPLVCTNGSCVSVSCAFAVEDDTATRGSDFAVTTTDVVFPAAGNANPNDQLVATADVQILSDTLAEGPETFKLVITSCRTGSSTPIVVNGRTQATVTIDDADFIAYEVSVAAAASTANAVEGATLELDVQRNSPPQFVQLGFTVDWQLTAVDGGPLGAFSSTSGSLAFGPFNETVHLSIPIADNSDPEPPTAFTFALLNPQPPSVAQLAGAAASTRAVQLAASDGFLGTFRFAATTTLKADEGETLDITVERVGGDPAAGSVELAWTLSPASTSDFAQTSGVLSFPPNATAGTIRLEVRNDSVPELREAFSLSLVLANSTSSLSVQATAPDAASNDAFFLSSTASARPIAIRAHGFPAGVVGFASDPATTSGVEDGAFGVISLPLTREAGSTGSVVVSYTVVGGGADFVSSSGLVFFPDGVATTTLSLAVVDDDLPELAESFTVELTNPQNGAQLDPLRRAVLVTIAASDDPQGVFGFDPADQIRSVSEQPGTSASGRSLTLQVLRSRGTSGAVSVGYTVTRAAGDPAAPSPPALDIAPAAGTLDFADGQTTAAITLTVLGDALPEAEEVFDVVLSAPAGGARLSSNQSALSARVHVVANDHLIAFAAASAAVQVGEAAGTVVLTLSRPSTPLSLAAASTVTYTLRPSPPPALSATLAADMALDPGATLAGAPTLATVSLPAGQASASFVVQIVDDAIPEGTESFLVDLVNATGDYVVNASSSATVAILDNDDGAGVFGFQAALNLPPGSPSPIPTLQANESTVLNITVTRLAEPAGAIGRVAVTYLLSGPDVAGDFVGQSAGAAQLVFADGETTKTLVLTLAADALPELAKTYTLQLTAASDGGRIRSNVSSLTIVLAANDEPHGVLQLASASASPPPVQVRVSNTTSASRDIGVTVQRLMGLNGELSITLGLTYLSAASGLSVPGLLAPSHVVTMPAGQPQTTFALPIPPASSLTTGDRIVVELQAVTLLGDLAATPGAAQFPPQLAAGAAARSAEALVPQTAASGTIAIAASSRVLAAIEPADGQPPAAVAVTLTRSGGLYGDVNITWAVDPAASAPANEQLSGADLAAASGSVTMPHLAAETTLTLSVVADAEPELAEQGLLRLSSVTSGVATLATPASQTTASLTVAENDSPRGVFAFAADTSTPTLVYEPGSEPASGGGSSVAVVRVVRSGGRLGSADITYTLFSMPGGAVADASEIVGGSGRLVFLNGQAEQTIVFQAVDDIFAELAEHFELRLSSTTAELGAFTVLPVTVPLNDDALGVFDFDELTSVQVAANELRDRNDNVELTVVREAGALGAVQVPWTVFQCDPTLADCTLSTNKGNASADLTPTSGSLAFALGTRRQTLTLFVRQDTHFEPDEVFVVQLGAPVGGGRLASPVVQARLTVLANDDPLGFAAGEPQQLVVGEDAGVVLLNVTRGGLAADQARLNVATRDVTPVSASVARAYTPISTQLVFQPGERTKTIAVSLLADSIPQPDRVFQVVLSESAQPGETVLDPLRSTVTVTVRANDNAGGTLGFDADSLRVVVHESVGQLDLNVTRAGGAFAELLLVWNASSTCRGELDSLSGQVHFAPGVTRAPLTLTITDDAIPELEEECAVVLTLVQTVSAGQGTGQLDATGSTSALVVIAKNDGANGLFGLGGGEQSLLLTSEGGQVQVPITRDLGTFGDVRLLWDIQPSAGADTVDVPDFHDLLFAGVGVDSATLVPTPLPFGAEAYRSNVAALSLVFDGTQHVRVPAAAQPTSSALAADFTLALWVKQSPGTDGVLVAKYHATASGATAGSGLVAPDTLQPVAPTLVLSSHPSANKLRLVYRLSTQPSGTNTTLDVALPAASALDDGAWHWLAVVVRQGTTTQGTVQRPTVSVFVDGASGSAAVAEQTPLLPPAAPGALGATLGDVDANVASPAARAAGQHLRVGRDLSTSSPVDVFRGELQDVRFFNAALSPAQLAEVHMPSAGLDVSPVAGEVLVPAGSNGTRVPVTFLADSVPELPENFTFRLRHADGGALLRASARETTFTIDGSDNPYGVFAFAASAEPLSVAEAGGAMSNDSNSHTLAITRSTAAAGEVTLAWTIEACRVCLPFAPFSCSPCATPAGGEADFAATSGTVTFAAGQLTANLTLTVLDDAVPEADEHFTLRLAVAAGSGLSPTGSGQLLAAVNTSSATREVVVAASDDAFGRFALVSPSTSPGGAEHDPIIVAESGTGVGVPLTFAVRRAGGSAGRVTVDFEVVPGAGSADIDPTSVGDVTPATSSVVFEDGVTEASAQVLVVDDTLPERNESFVIRLVAVHPRGALAVDADALYALILPNDNFRGLISFPLSNSFVVHEPSTARLPVERSAGAFGELVIGWQIQSPSSFLLDVEPLQGTVRIPDGANRTDIVVSILRDGQVEVAETLVVVLTQVAGGAALATPTSASLVIAGNGNPHGSFKFNGVSLVVSVAEPAGATNTSVVLGLQRGGGTIGRVTVTLRTRADPATSAPRNTAEAGSDYMPLGAHTVVFEDGERAKTFSVLVRGDDIPELEERFAVEIVSLELDPADVRGPYSDPSPRMALDTLAVISITENDNPRGTVQFQTPAASVTVDEATGLALGSGEDVFVLERTGGSFGAGSVDYIVLVSITNGAEGGGVDFSGDSGTVVFADGQSIGRVGVSILDDNVPEIGEQLTVVLFNPTGGLALGARSELVVTIGSNDEPNGILSLLPSLVLGDDAGNTNATAFRLDPAQLSGLASSPNPDLARLDLTVHSSLAAPRWAVRVLEGGQAELIISRARGLFGAVSVQWQLRPATAPLVREHGLPVDNTGARLIDVGPASSGGTVTLAAGQATARIVVAVTADGLPEDDEWFVVSLQTVAGGARLNSTHSQVAVYVPASNDAFGVLSMESTQVQVVENGTRSLLLGVPRQSGLRRALRLHYAVRMLTAAELLMVEAAAVDGSLTAIDGPFALALFSAPIEGWLADTSVRVARLDGVQAASECLRACFIWAGGKLASDSESAGACVAVSYDAAGGRCYLHNSTADATATNAPLMLAAPTASAPWVYYELQANASARLASHLARGGAAPEPGAPLSTSASTPDFVNASATVALAAGQSAGAVAATIIDDLVGEASELFVVELTGVALEHAYIDVAALARLLTDTGSDLDLDPEGVAFASDGGLRAGAAHSASYSVAPRLSMSTTHASPDIAEGRPSTVVAILASDNPRGILTLDAAASATVAQEPNAALPSAHPAAGRHLVFVVVRQGGAAGLVRVNWTLPGLAAGEQLDGPRQGQLVFADGVVRQEVRFAVLDDSVPEVDSTVVFELRDVSGGASLGVTRMEALLLGNDNGNGVFVLAAADTLLTVHEGGLLQAEVRRSTSALGAVAVQWELVGVGGDAAGTLPSAPYTLVPASDFAAARGSVVFAEGEVSATISVAVAADLEPEVRERFALRLTGADQPYAQIGSEDASGGSPEPMASNGTALLVDIEANDNPFGRLAVSVDRGSRVVDEDPPGANASSRAVVRIERLDGRFGSVRVFYETTAPAGDANTTATPGVDFVAQSGTVLFAPGQAVVELEVEVLDDAQPELAETFAVVLVEAELLLSGDAVGDAGPGGLGLPADLDSPRLATLRRAEVTIAASDDAYGVFDFDAAQAAALAARQFAEGESAVVTIVRSGGALASVEVVVEVLPSLMQPESEDSGESPDVAVGAAGQSSPVDMFPARLTVIFAEGERTQMLALNVLDDMLPELAETVTVRLTTAAPSSPYRIGGLAGELTLHVAASDAPYGRFGFVGDAAVEVVLDEDADEDAALRSTLALGRGAGAVGEVTVAWALVFADGTPVEGSADAGSFVATRGEVTFVAGQRSGEFSVELRPDTTPECEARYSVALSVAGGRPAEIVGGGSGGDEGEGEDGSGSSGDGDAGTDEMDSSGLQTTATVAVRASDDPDGFLAFSGDAVVTAFEGSRRIELSVTRTRGTCSPALLRWTTSPDSALGPAGDHGAVNANIARASLAPVSMRVEELGAIAGVATVELMQPAASTSSSISVLDPSRVVSGVSIVAGDPSVGFGTGKSAVSVLAWMYGLPEPVGVMASADAWPAPGVAVADVAVQARRMPAASASSSPSSSPSPSVHVAFAQTADGAAVPSAGVLVAALTVTPFVERARSLPTNASMQMQGVPLAVAAGVAATPVPTTGLSGAEIGAVAFLELASGGGAGTGERFLFAGAADAALSSLLRWEAALGRYTRIQQVPVSHVRGAVTFEYASAAASPRVFLAVAVQGPSETANPTTSPRSLSQIYELRASGSLALVAQVDSHAAEAWVALNVPGGPSAALLPHLLLVSSSGPARLHVFEPGATAGSGSLLPGTDVAGTANGAHGAHAFAMLGNQSVVALASQGDASPIYVWDASGSPAPVTKQVGALRPVASVALPQVGVLSSLGDGGGGDVQRMLLAVQQGTAANTLQTERLAVFAEGGDFSPASGELRFAPGATSARLVVDIADDTLPELDEEFQVRLTEVVFGGAKLQLDGTGGTGGTGQALERTVLIASNDNPEGIVGFHPDSLAALVAEPAAGSPAGSINTVVLQLERLDGTFGFATVEWSALVVGGDGAPLATDIIQPLAGEVVFAPGARTANITLSVGADTHAETEAVVAVELTGVRGGAQLTAGRSRALVTVVASDEAYGVFSLAQTQRLVVDEGVGMVAVDIVRTNSSRGTVEVTVETSMAPTTGGGLDDALPGLDFAALTQTPVTFAEGELVKTVPVTIFDDSVPERREHFAVRLVAAVVVPALSAPAAASPTPRIGANREVVVEIAANDEASGVFVVNSGSRALQVEEDEGVVAVQVSREGGAFGDVVVEWMLRPDTALAGADFLEPGRLASGALGGTLQFAAGVSTATISIGLVDDTLPEIDERFSVVLVNVSGGVSGSPPALGASDAAREAVVTIAENDNARGVFSVAAVGGVTVVAEGGQLGVRISRSGGDIGLVSLSYEVENAADGTPNSLDLQPSAGLVSFADGERERVVNLTAIEDGLPEGREALQVALHVVLGGGVLAGGGDVVRLAVAVAASDSNSGLFALPSGPLVRSEPEFGSASLVVPVTRTVGLAGAVQLRWRLDGLCGAGEGEGAGADCSGRASVDDFASSQPLAGTVDFADGQSTGEIVVGVVGDGVPEGDETFQVVIEVDEAALDAGTQSASVGVAAVEVGIPFSNDGRGVIGLSAAHTAGVEVTEPGMVNLTVLRSVAAFGTVFASWQLQVTGVGAGHAALADFAQTSGMLVFADGQAEAVLSLVTVDDAEREIAETISVVLADTAGGARLDLSRPAATRVQATVRSNDDVFGRFDWQGPAIFTLQGAQRIVEMQIVRTGGSLGAVRVAYGVRFESDVAETSDAALLNGLCDAPAECATTFADGETTRTVQLVVPATVFLELDERFVFVLGAATSQQADTAGDAAEVGEEFAAEVPVTVANNVVGFDQGLASVVLVEGSRVNMTIDRRSLRGLLTVDWALIAADGDFAPASGTVDILPGQRQAEVALVVALDGEPELRETHELQLSNVRLSGDNFRERDTTLALTIERSDQPNGVFGFATAAQTVQEDAGLVEILLERSGGAFGAVQLVVQVGLPLVAPIQLGGGADATIVNAAVSGQVLQYVVDFPAGQREATFGIRVRDDTQPEEAESLTLDLVSATLVGAEQPATEPPTLAGGRRSLTFIIAKSDDPQGRIGFVRTTPLAVSEAAGEVALALQRLGGTSGTVTALVTVTPASGIITPSGGSQVATTDFEVVGGGVVSGGGGGDELTVLVTFAPGERDGEVRLRIVDDSVPELAETITLTLGQPTGGAAIDPSPTRAAASVVIEENDDPRGVFGLAAGGRGALPGTGGAVAVARESDGAAELVVTRGGGALEAAVVDWTVVLGSAGGDAAAARLLASRADFVGVQGRVAFAAGQTSALLRITLQADGVPELAERFEVQLSTPTAGARLASQAAGDGANARSRITVEVASNEDPYGRFAFSCEDRLGGSNADGQGHNVVRLTVHRRGGSIGETSVVVETTGDGTAGSGLFIAIDRTLVFAEGVRNHTVQLVTNPLPAGATEAATVVLRLGGATGGAVVADVNDGGVSVVTIYESDFTARVLAAAQQAQCRPEAFSPADTPVGGTGGGGGGGASASQAPRVFGQANYAAQLDAVRGLLDGDPEFDANVEQAAVLLLGELLVPENVGNGVSDFGGAGDVVDDLGQAALQRRGREAAAAAGPAAEAATSFCPGSDQLELGGGVASVLVTRVATAQELNGLRFGPLQSSAAVQHALQLPRALFADDDAQTCLDLVYTDYRVATWFPVGGVYYKDKTTRLTADFTVMHNKVISVELPAGTDPGRITSTDPIVYSVGAVADTDGEDHFGERVCVWWDTTLEDGRGAWSGEGCRLSSGTLELAGDGADVDGTVTCECNHATQFAVLVPRVEEERLHGAAIASLILLALMALVVLIVHLACGDNIRTDHVVLLVNLCIAMVLSGVLTVVSSYTARDANRDGCATLGLVVHYFVLAQFTWIMAICLHLYLTQAPAYAGSCCRGRSGLKMALYCLLGWGLSLAILVVYVGVQTGAQDTSFADTYGDTRGVSELCFIPEERAAGIALAMMLWPLLALAAMVLVLVVLQRQRTADWLASTDLYLGRPNQTEVKVAGGLGVLLFFCYLFAACEVYDERGTSAFAWIMLVFTLGFCAYATYFYVLNRTVRALARGEEVEKRTTNWDAVPGAGHSRFSKKRKGNMVADGGQLQDGGGGMAGVPAGGDYEAMELAARQGRYSQTHSYLPPDMVMVGRAPGNGQPAHMHAHMHPRQGWGADGPGAGGAGAAAAGSAGRVPSTLTSKRYSYGDPRASRVEESWMATTSFSGGARGARGHGGGGGDFGDGDYESLAAAVPMMSGGGYHQPPGQVPDIENVNGHGVGRGEPQQERMDGNGVGNGLAHQHAYATAAGDGNVNDYDTSAADEFDDLMAALRSGQVAAPPATPGASGQAHENGGDSARSGVYLYGDELGSTETLDLDSSDFAQHLNVQSVDMADTHL